jgi:hypothetical protein
MGQSNGDRKWSLDEHESGSVQRSIGKAARVSDKRQVLR